MDMESDYATHIGALDLGSLNKPELIPTAGLEVDVSYLAFDKAARSAAANADSGEFCDCVVRFTVP